MPESQSAQSHTARDPLYIACLILILFSLLSSLYFLWRGWPHQKHLHVGWVLVSLVLVPLGLRLRTYSFKVQDRIIRLEERQRIAALVPTADLGKLSTRQLIALRFASDADLHTLVSRTIVQGLDPKAIKQAIVTWRPDYERI